jgi:flavin reductase (DIM6/NTAB) family NADH-FMN oxidoreductase RutF
MVASATPSDVHASSPVIERPGSDLPVTISSSEFCTALTNLTTAVSVIATNGPAGLAGLTCSAVCGVSATPATMVACVNRRSAAHDVITRNDVFCINCLPAARKDLSDLFAGVGRVPMAERFAADQWTVLATGAPCAKDALAAFDCKLADVREIGTHSVLIGYVVATTQNNRAEPLVFQRQQYATTRLL